MWGQTKKVQYLLIIFAASSPCTCMLFVWVFKRAKCRSVQHSDNKHTYRERLHTYRESPYTYRESPNTHTESLHTHTESLHTHSQTTNWSDCWTEQFEKWFVNTIQSAAPNSFCVRKCLYPVQSLYILPWMLSILGACWFHAQFKASFTFIFQSFSAFHNWSSMSHTWWNVVKTLFFKQVYCISNPLILEYFEIGIAQKALVYCTFFEIRVRWNKSVDEKIIGVRIAWEFCGLVWIG